MAPQSEIKDKDKISIWLRDDVDVVVPLWREAADFPLRVGEVLESLERIENRSQEQILKDSSQPSQTWCALAPWAETTS
jgi:hypothetical protein